MNTADAWGDPGWHSPCPILFAFFAKRVGKQECWVRLSWNRFSGNAPHPDTASQPKRCKPAQNPP